MKLRYLKHKIFSNKIYSYSPFYYKYLLAILIWVISLTVKLNVLSSQELYTICFDTTYLGDFDPNLII